VTPAHLAKNIDVFTFALASQDHDAISRLDSTTGRIGYDPGTQGW
jgi:diketogulonate reductase-like aldo/keto reductase